MGLMDKLKNIFTEEVEEEVKPIKKEVVQVPIAAPVKEEKEEESKTPLNSSTSDSEILKEKDEKFVFPVFFDDEDFTKLEETKPKKEVKIAKDYGTKIDKEEVKKVFKPTPIISPVYGVLDKNYHKEDITSKNHESEYATKKEMTVDDIRNKAFGTLEDDLENTLYGKNSIFFNEEEVEDNSDIFEELEDKSEEAEHNSVDDFLNSETGKNIGNENLEIIEDDEPLTRTRKYRIKEELAEVESTEEIEDLKEENIETNLINDELEKEYVEEKENKNDLFDLVDSMYDEKEDE